MLYDYSYGFPKIPSLNQIFPIVSTHICLINSITAADIYFSNIHSNINHSSRPRLSGSTFLVTLAVNILNAIPTWLHFLLILTFSERSCIKER